MPTVTVSPSDQTWDFPVLGSFVRVLDYPENRVWVVLAIIRDIGPHKASVMTLTSDNDSEIGTQMMVPISEVKAFYGTIEVSP